MKKPNNLVFKIAIISILLPLSFLIYWQYKKNSEFNKMSACGKLNKEFGRDYEFAQNNIRVTIFYSPKFNSCIKYEESFKKDQSGKVSYAHQSASDFFSLKNLCSKFLTNESSAEEIMECMEKFY